MKKRVVPNLILAAALVAVAARGSVITVDTIDNINPGVGKTSLKMALSSLHDGDRVQFNIPGTGPFFLLSPPDGYPVITANNVTIDGYSQPGAQPNTNSILAPNNAKLMIVLDARNGNFTSMDLWSDNPRAGYASGEYAILGVVRGTNVTIQGLSLLGVPPGFDNNIGTGNHDYGIAFGCDDTGTPTGGHVSGCWIGVAPDGKTLSGTTYAITGFRWRDVNSQNPVTTDDLTIGVGKNSTNAPAEFNVIIDTAIPMIIEGNRTRISGNFIGVFPDGVTEYNVALVTDTGGTPIWTGDFQYEGAIEIGRGGNDTVIGTDGDGVNDANERNIIVGTMPPSMNGYDHTIEFYGNTPGTNIVIAGNYIGVGINGTYFTNGVPAINASAGTAQYRIGSNFDGVSDDVEGNFIVNNWPPDVFPSFNWTDLTQLNFFDEIAVGSTISLRGNSLIDNFPYPVSPTKASGANLFVDDYYASVLLDVTKGVKPVLFTNTTITRLVGSVPLAIAANWPTTIIDLYGVDPVGVTNGQANGFPELPNGFVQGRAYAGSFVDNGPKDRDSRLGYFDFDISTLDTKGSLITVTANYVNTNSAIVMTSPFAEPASVTFIPGSIESVGLKRIVPDTVVTNPAADTLGNWEPYASVLGTSTFLISGGTYAADQNDPNVVNNGTITAGAPYQSFVVYLQPATGGLGKLTECFFTDAGAPYGGPVNFSRQNGNPPRVVGDKRPGATNYMTAAETSAGQNAVFSSDSRWSSNLIYQANNRYVTVQPFSLNTSTLVPTPQHKAFDAVYGTLASQSDLPAGNNAPQCSRTGGTVAGLDDGNFVVVIDDKTALQNAGGEVTTASIIKPDGTIVKDRFLVDPRDIWDNVTACKGGFCVRVHNLLYFYDNAGNLKGSVDQSTSGESYDTGRGDGTRIGGHINSPYVYLIGKVSTENTVRVSVFDSTTQTFVTKADVSEGAFTGGFDRANIAVDALNNFTATWVSQPADYTQQQVAARVMAFDPVQKKITALTPSFFPFINYSTGSIRTLGMTVAMTTKQIMVAAKGEINLENNPVNGPDSPKEVNFFTVFSHPFPQDDPTPPVGGVTTIKLAPVTVSAGNLVLTWTGGTGPYTVQKKDALSDATWQTVTTTPSTTASVPVSGATGFFRIMQ